MARKVRAASLETRTSRLKLTPRKKSYFVTVTFRTTATARG